MLGKYAFSNRVIDNWNLLSANCVNCSTITLSRNTSHLNLNRKLQSLKWVSCDSRHYTAKACAYSYQHRLWRHAGIGEFGEKAQCGQGRGLPTCQVSPLSMQRFGHNTPTSQTGQTGQWSIGIERTVLQTVAQKLHSISSRFWCILCCNFIWPQTATFKFGSSCGHPLCYATNYCAATWGSKFESDVATPLQLW